MGKLSVQAIDTALVLKVIEPLWTTKSETAGRLRGRIESVLDWAKVRGYRAGENPARWRGHLDKLLPPVPRCGRSEHHAALPYAEMSVFMTRLREQEGIAARALEFAVLTAARTGEVIGARWSEMIWQEGVDRPRWAHEGGQGAPRPAVHSHARYLARHAAASPREDGFVFPGGKAADRCRTWRS